MKPKLAITCSFSGMVSFSIDQCAQKGIKVDDREAYAKLAWVIEGSELPCSWVTITIRHPWTNLVRFSHQTREMPRRNQLSNRKTPSLVSVERRGLTNREWSTTKRGIVHPSPESELDFKTALQVSQIIESCFGSRSPQCDHPKHQLPVQSNLQCTKSDWLLQRVIAGERWVQSWRRTFPFVGIRHRPLPKAKLLKTCWIVYAPL